MLKFILLFVMLASQALGSIGTVTAAKSPGSLERETGEKLNSDLDVELEQNDKIETFQGGHRLTFIDDTIVDMTAQSVLVIDDYVYDPANNEGSLGLIKICIWKVSKELSTERKDIYTDFKHRCTRY